MSKIVNNPADRKAIIWDQSHLSKFLMFIPLALFCFFYFLILSCINVWKTQFSHRPCFAILKEGQGRFMTALSSHTTNKKITKQIKIFSRREFRWCFQCTVFTSKCLSSTIAVKLICNTKPFSATFIPS